MQQKVYFLLGPTASGKTALAIKLSQELPLRIISIDSAMVYRGMDIGTAKPTAAELQQTPHALINIREPHEIFSTGDFVSNAHAEIAVSWENGQIPLFVGGTMLYAYRLQQGIATLPKANLPIRTKILEEAQQMGWPALHEKLLDIDPLHAQDIHPHDLTRITRALEIYYSTGKTRTHVLQTQAHARFPYPVRNFLLVPRDRNVLRTHIAKRLNTMLQMGLIAEVEQLLHDARNHADLPAFKSVGYQQVIQFLAGEIDKTEMQERIYFATCQLAKRQLTWLRQFQQAICFACDEDDVYTRILTLFKREVYASF